MAFIEPMHRNKPNITYLLTYFMILRSPSMFAGSLHIHKVVLVPSRLNEFVILGAGPMPVTGRDHGPDAQGHKSKVRCIVKM